jgi:ferric-dicitrate binding protein FerR (iron transport regulator)
MNPYLTYTAEDLACDDDFLRWVKYPERYPQLDAFWKRWLDDHPEKAEIVAEARCLVLAVLADDEFLPGETKQSEIWQKIRLSSGFKTSSHGISTWRQWYSRAAIVLICLSFVWYVSRDNTPEQNAEVTSESAEVQFVRHVNNAHSPNTIVLSDGSSIIMEPQSVLEYPEVFAPDLRQVRLTGQAFFEVTRDPQRPFLVHSGEIITRVLGTSFTVRNLEEEDNVVVQVKTGKVSVFMAGERDNVSKPADKIVEGVVLMPNQQVVYEKDPMKMTKSLVENPAVLMPPARQNFEFADAPIGEVFEAIEEAYGVEIVFDEQALASCYLNASLDDVALYDKLKLICRGINASYEIMDSHIIIYGKGCREEIINQTP